jgi:phosphopantetheine--protein transferase-like protein
MYNRVGIDLVYLPGFKETLRRQDDTFLSKIFHPTELVDKSPENLAAIFAAKEATIKVLGFIPESWLSIEIKHLKTGAPTVSILNNKKIKLSLSISHEHDYVIAVVLSYK